MRKYPTQLTINEFLQLFTSGAKSVSSIRRKFFQLKDMYPIGEVNDLVRATVVMSSYEVTPSLLVNLHSFLENFKGYVTKKNSGYTGIHAQFLYQGFRAEIQFTTQEALAAKKQDDDRYHHREDLLFEVQSLRKKSNITETEENLLQQRMDEIDKLTKAEKDSKIIFSDTYMKNGLYENIEQIESLLHLYSAYSKPIVEYENPILNSTEKSDKVVEMVANLANVTQFNMENTLLEELHEFMPTKIIMPDELNHFSDCDQRLKSLAKSFRASNNDVSSKDLIKIKDDLLHEYIRESLDSGQYNIDKLENIMQNKLNNLVVNNQEEK